MDKRIYILLVIFITGMGCRKPFNPVIVSADKHYLVVEGLININDSTFFKLSRTVTLSTGTTTRPELNANIAIQSDQSNSYALQEAGNGLYSGPPFNLPVSAKYRLWIKTSDGKEYMSDYVPAQTTPPIDNISYIAKPDGVQFYVDAHDPANNTRYYRWDFDETWKYHSAFQSKFKLGPDGLPKLRITYVDSLDNIYDCYKTGPSQNVYLGSSAKLSQDVISKQPLGFIKPETGKLSHGYGILLKQYALTKDGFAYWQILKTDSQDLGSIFDAQPSSLKGNIHSVSDPNEPVIGYISASSISIKRIYVDPTDLHGYGYPDYIPPPDDAQCPSGLILIAPAGNFKERLKLVVGSGDTVLVDAIQPMGAPAIIGYSYAAKECADCRAKPPFGTNVKPAFFPSY